MQFPPRFWLLLSQPPSKGLELWMQPCRNPSYEKKLSPTPLFRKDFISRTSRGKMWPPPPKRTDIFAGGLTWRSPEVASLKRGSLLGPP